jgi:transposase
MPRRHELTDAQWERIKDLLPGKKSDPGRTAADNRRFVNAVVYVLKTGIPWADLPGRFGKPDTARKRFDRWCAAGVWARVAGAAGDADLREVQLDSTSVKAHPVAATGRRRPREKKTPRTPAGAWAAAAAG